MKRATLTGDGALCMPSLQLRQIWRLDEKVAALVLEAELGGHRFMRRLQDDWDSGDNRFLARGEFLLAGYLDERLIAIGGLNIDPYALSQRIGRVRHVYVSTSARRMGVGTTLVKRIMNVAAPSFTILRLRTDTVEAAGFYASLGFRSTTDEHATHVVTL